MATRLGIAYHDELIELRKKFNVVDKTDNIAIRQWFASYPHLSNNDHAQIANLSVPCIRRLKYKAGLKQKAPANLPKGGRIREVINITPPTNWEDNPIWLNKMIKMYSASQLANACGVSRYVIYNRLRRHNIKWEDGRRSKNKYCTKDWCLKHYVEFGWSQARCAKQAGICQQAFANWLNRFKIPIRTARETLKSHTIIQLWVRKLFYKLQEHPTVHKVYLRHDHIHVRFKNYFWETYYVTRKLTDRRPLLSYIISKEDAKLENIPPVLPEYESNLLETTHDEFGIINTPHIIINNLKSASLLERRIAIHEFCRQITQRQWMWPEHPEHILLKEWDKLCAFDPTTYMHKDMFSIFIGQGHPALGRKITEHFFDISEYSSIFKSPRMVMRMLNILSKRNESFNFHNLLRIFTYNNFKLPYDKHNLYQTYRMTDPAAYATIFKQLGITGSILDLQPGFGNRTIAAAMQHLRYYTVPDERFQKALNKGLAEFIELDYEEWNNQKVDILLYDNNFGAPDMNIVLKYMKYTKKMMVFVPDSLKSEYQIKYKPKSIIKLKTRWFKKTPDHIFIW